MIINLAKYRKGFGEADQIFHRIISINAKNSEKKNVLLNLMIKKQLRQITIVPFIGNSRTTAKGIIKRNFHSTLQFPIHPIPSLGI